MKLILPLLIFSTLARALPVTVPCSASTEKLLQSWGASDDWRKQFRDGRKDFFFAAPTAKVGEWVLLAKDGSVVSKANELGRIEVKFGKDCAMITTPFTNDVPRDFHDTDLRKFVEKNRTGIIYVWSPQMGLSVDGVKEIRAAAKELKLPLLVLAEAQRPESEYQRVLAKTGPAARVDSFEFRMRDVGQHYPALLVFKDKKILSGVKYGYEKAPGYRLDLARLFGQP